jgi:hypothetical protein
MSENKTPLTKRDRQLRRRVWLGVYLPVVLGGLVALALVVLVAVFGFRTENLGDDPASVASDVAAILVILQALIILLVPLALSVALAYLAVRLNRWIHPLLKRGQDLTALASEKVIGLMDAPTDAVIRAASHGARWQAVKNYLRRSNV